MITSSLCLMGGNDMGMTLDRGCNAYLIL